MASEIPLCRCGQPTHPLYGSRCEDCYSLDNTQFVIGQDGNPINLSKLTPDPPTGSAGGGRRVIRGTNNLGG